MASAKPVVVVFTGNSNTGFATIEAIKSNPAFNSGVTIRAVFRSKDAQSCLKELELGKDDDMQVIIGDIAKTQVLGPVFEGCDAAFFSTPTHQDRVKLGKLFVDACLAHGVRHGVIMSYIGAEKEETTYARQFSEIEKYAQSKSGQPVKVALADRGHMKFAPIIVRSCPFYQNFYGVLQSIKDGTLYYPLQEYGKLAHLDFGDVGRAVAAILADPPAHGNKVYNLIGDVMSGAQIAAAIQMKAGVPCIYENVPDKVAVQAFAALGLQRWIAEGNVEQLKWIREGNCDGYEKGDYKKITGLDHVRFGEFVKDFLKPMLV